MNRKKIEELIRNALEELGVNTTEDLLQKTPERVAELLEEIFKDVKKDPLEEIHPYKTDVKNEIIILKEIPFFSFCEHHLLPFFGRVHIAYIPRDGVIAGFSHFVSMINVISRRLQLQERLCDEIAETVSKALKAEGVMVLIESRHLCVEIRGEKPFGTEVVTISVKGKMNETSIKEIALGMVGCKERV